MLLHALIAFLCGNALRVQSKVPTGHGKEQKLAADESLSYDIVVKASVFVPHLIRMQPQITYSF